MVPSRPISIVVPCYNEATRLDADAFRIYLEHNPRVDFIFVDDGSRDSTLSVLRSLSVACPSDRAVVHSLPQNCGKAEAVRQGVEVAIARGANFVGFWDADLATPLSSIDEFVRVMDRYPHLALVMGARVKLLGRDIERLAMRHYLGRVFATAVSVVLSLPVYDTQCGAKLFRVGDEVRSIFQATFRTKWIFDVEIIARMVQFRRQHRLPTVDGVIYEFPLERWHDVHGSKVRPKDYVKAIRDLWVIYTTYLRTGASN